MKSVGEDVLSHAANVLLDDFSHDASTNGAATFADSEAEAVFHGDWHDQLNVISRCRQA